MARSCIVLFCGLPGAGKSFLARKLFERLLHKSLQDGKVDATEVQATDDNMRISKIHTMIICYDDIIPMDLYDEEELTESKYSCCNQKRWKEQRKLINNFIGKVLQTCMECDGKLDEFVNKEIAIDDSIASKIDKEFTCSCFDKAAIGSHRKNSEDLKHIIVVDDNMFYTSMRYEHYQMARQYCSGFLQIHVSCDMSVILERNGARTKPVSDTTIHRMSSNFEIPDKNRNEWEKNTINIDSTDEETENKLDNIIHMIKFCLENPVDPLPRENMEEREKTRNANLKSILHQADNVLRKYVSSEIKQMKDASKYKDNITQDSCLGLLKKKKIFFSNLKTSHDVLQQLEVCWTSELNLKTNKIEQDKKLLTCDDPLIKYDHTESSIREKTTNIDLCVERTLKFEEALKIIFTKYEVGKPINLLDWNTFT